MRVLWKIELSTLLLYEYAVKLFGVLSTEREVTSALDFQ